ncbi:MAG TPA: hypothetical protein DDW45_00620 [Gammaproteobacteria bacterium]|nr:hypothetical protein [Gammaproteobacteria bacterium]
MKLHTVAILLSTSVASSAWAASFDCSEAQSRVEKSICSTPALNQLDARMGYAWKKLLAAEGSNKQRYIKQQREWLKERNQECSSGDKHCMEVSYHEQIRKLERQLAIAIIQQRKSCNGISENPHLSSAINENGGWSTYVDSDTLILDPLDDQHIAFSLSVSGENTHMCNLTGIASKKSGHYAWTTTHFAYDSGEAQRCTLRFHSWEHGYQTISIPQNKDNITAMNCHTYYCGMRAAIPEGDVFIPVSRLKGDDSYCKESREIVDEL